MRSRRPVRALERPASPDPGPQTTNASRFSHLTDSRLGRRPTRRTTVHGWSLADRGWGGGVCGCGCGCAARRRGHRHKVPVGRYWSGRLELVPRTASRQNGQTRQTGRQRERERTTHLRLRSREPRLTLGSPLSALKFIHGPPPRAALWLCLVFLFSLLKLPSFWHFLLSLTITKAHQPKYPPLS